MNAKTKNFSPILRITVAIISQCILGALSLITGIIMPKYMGPEAYGYYQIYFFYSGYINLLGLGFNDGLVLKYAGYDITNMPYKQIRSAIRLILTYLFVITAVFAILILLLFNNESRSIYLVLASNIIPTIIFCIIISIFLAANHSVLYNMAGILQKLAASILFVYFILRKKTGYLTMILSDTGARYFSTIIICFIGYKFLIGKGSGIKSGIYELKTSISSGVKVMISVLLSGLIPMFGRVVIEYYEPIEVYGVYTFALSLLSIILTFTSTIGIIIFPMIKRITQDKLAAYYDKLSTAFEVFMSCAFIVYIPLVLFIKNYMTDYVDALNYLSVLISVCYPLGKMQLLLFSYYKAYRLEKDLLLMNAFALLSMIIGTFGTYLITKSVLGVACMTTVIMTIFLKISEKHLYKKMGILYRSVYYFDISMMLIFILLSMFTNLVTFSILYSLSLLIFLFARRKRIIDASHDIMSRK